ncbi:MAG TPA: hypothetical protein VK919_04800 [Solirubrobacterales bacterium]|nr:hypothetical protein [Solirubrobacterales bacterium]
MASQERGQGTVEWVGLVLLVSLAALAAAAAAGGVPGAEVGRAIGSKLACAVRIGAACDPEADPLAAEYGPKVAAMLREHAPTIHLSGDADQLPVDHRRCREPACATASRSGRVSRTAAGLPATAFTRVVDCRPEAAERTESAGADCSGERAGNVYLQFWLYYPDSRTEPWGEWGHHRDDWESLQVRVGSRVDGRASSHRSYNYRGGIRNWASDAGIRPRPGWGPYTGELHVTSASHAGHVRSTRRGTRRVPARRLRLVPIEPLDAAAGSEHDFAVVPPWLKPVYTDPEETGT